MKVRAKETVFYKGSRVRAFQVLEIGDAEKVPSYFEKLEAPEVETLPVESETVVIAGKRGRKPNTIHEYALNQ